MGYKRNLMYLLSSVLYAGLEPPLATLQHKKSKDPYKDP